jgi:OOP family OmpA-OmpF porin
MKNLYVLLALMLLTTAILSAQPSNSKNTDDIKGDSTEQKNDKIKYNSWELALILGMGNYYGDLASNNFFPGGTKSGNLNWNAGLKLKYNFSRYFGFQGDVGYSNLAAQKTDGGDYYQGSTFDMDLGVFINMATLLDPHKYNKKWYWDIQFLFGGSKYNSDLYDANDKLLQSGDDLPGMVGIGSNVQFRISKHLDLGLDLRVNFVGNDKLDLIEKGKSNDAYGHFAIQLGYTFGKNEEAYKWNPLKDELKELWDAVNKNADNIDSLDKRVTLLESYHGKGTETLADDDNDGVANEFDLSPNTPEGTLVNFQGIPIPIPVQDTTAQNGARVSSEAGSGTVLGSVFFDYNRATVNRSDYKKLASIAQYMKMHNGATVKIVGHTDKHGSDEYNKKLSEKRSQKVLDILVNGFGIDKSRFEVVAEGKNSSLSDKYDDVNRRVDVIIK